MDEGDYDRAAAACDSAVACAPPVSHDYARAAFYRSETERFRGDEAARFEWLVRAAMADVQGAVRDYGALGGVAEELLRRGDAARAMRCIRVAINDTQAYNSPIRSWRDMAILPQIEQAYSERNARLRAMYVALILLAFLFALSAIGGVLFVLRQNRRLNAVQQTLRESNGKLAELAASLRETNADLSRQNIRIADANRIKEVYIGGLLKTISEYIYKLADTYRHVGRMLRDGRSDELRREYAGTDVRSDELKEFYHNFDTTFLGLFPSFIGEFNRLLADDARIGVRRPGSLTTELRIFALVRLSWAVRSPLPTPPRSRKRPMCSPPPPTRTPLFRRCLRRAFPRKCPPTACRKRPSRLTSLQSSLPTPSRRSRKLPPRARPAAVIRPEKHRPSPCPHRKRWNRLHRPSTMRLPPSGVPFRMLLRSRTTRPDDLKYPLRKLRTLSRKYYFICKTGNDCGHFLFCFFTRKSVPINCIKMPPAS